MSNSTMQVCGAVFLGLGIALAVDEDAWKWFEHISGGMDDGLYSAAVWLMIGDLSYSGSIHEIIYQADPQPSSFLAVLKSPLWN